MVQCEVVMCCDVLTNIKVLYYFGLKYCGVFRVQSHDSRRVSVPRQGREQKSVDSGDACFLSNQGRQNAEECDREKFLFGQWDVSGKTFFLPKFLNGKQALN